MNAQTKAFVLEFRISELKSVLNQLSLPTTGRKADLQGRVFHYFGEPFSGGPPSTSPAKEEWRLQAARNIVGEVYRQWKGPGSPGGRRGDSGRGQPVQGAGQAGGGQMARQAPAGGWSPRGGQDPGGGRVAGGAGHDHPHRAAGSGNAVPASGGVVETINAGENLRGAPQGVGPGQGANGRLASRPQPQPRQQAPVIRCICDVGLERGTMVQCEATGCGVWQHCDCLGLTPNAMPEHFYCEQCRAAWADPFWEVINPRVMPSGRLLPSGGPAVRGPGGVYEMEQVLDRTFQLTHPQIDLLKKANTYQLQAVSLVLGDPVAFRFQWPRGSELRINTMSYRVYSRQASSKVGNNLRDEPATLAQTVFPGRNRIRLKANDSRKVALLVQLVRRRDMEGVKALMAQPETLQAALQRVQQQVGGDDELSMGSSIISLKDPISGSRVTEPARFQGTNGLVAFDLDTFLNMAQRSRKWQCPHSMRHTRVQELQLDTYIAHILHELKDLPEVMEVEVSADGEWRPKDGGYAWTNIAESLAPPLPSTEVKPEPGGDDEALEDSEEELSEGEELRRAAKAYAAVAKRPNPGQEVIVLGSSSDEEEDQRAAKRRAVPTTSQATQPQPKPLHQQTIRGSMDTAQSRDASRRQSQHGANGHASGVGSTGGSGWGGSGSAARPANGAPGTSQPYSNGMAPGPSRSVHLTQGASNSGPTGIRIHLNPRSAAAAVGSPGRSGSRGASSSQPYHSNPGGSQPSRLASSQPAATSSHHHQGIPGLQGAGSMYGGPYTSAALHSMPPTSGTSMGWPYPPGQPGQQLERHHGGSGELHSSWYAEPPQPPQTLQASHMGEPLPPLPPGPPPPLDSPPPLPHATNEAPDEHEDYPGLVPMLSAFLDPRGEYGGQHNQASLSTYRSGSDAGRSMSEPAVIDLESD